MTEDNWKTLRVPPEAYDRAKEQKEKHGRTWGEQLVCDNPTTTEVVDAAEIVERLSQTSDVDTAEIADAVADRLGTGSDVQLDTADIIGRIEDLENTLPRKVASELSR
jgi:hypothetical protein